MVRNLFSRNGISIDIPIYVCTENRITRRKKSLGPIIDRLMFSRDLNCCADKNYGGYGS